MPTSKIPFEDRGFYDWRPQQKARELMGQVYAVLRLYIDHLPLTIRQIFYRLVARFAYAKNEKAYQSLINFLGRARRARWEFDDGRPLWEVIRDDKFTELEPFYYDDKAGFWDFTRNLVEDFTLDRQSGQHTRLVLWCEARGMTATLQRIGDPLGISVLSSGGFDGITDKHRLADDWATPQADGKHRRRRLAGDWATPDANGNPVPVKVLHIGDHDASGVWAFRSLAEDICVFAEQIAEENGWPEPIIEFVRIAALPSQVVAPNGREIYPSDYAKPTDTRDFSRTFTRIGTGLPDGDLLGRVFKSIPTPYVINADGSPMMRVLTNRDGTPKLDADGRPISTRVYKTWQAEAFPPDVFDRIVREAIAQTWDDEAYNAVLADEKTIRADLEVRLADAETRTIDGGASPMPPPPPSATPRFGFHRD